MAATIQRLVSFYQKHEFKIKEIIVDGNFQSSRTNLADLQINLNCISMDEHVPEAKILICMLKEYYRFSMYNTPFLKLPKCMVIGFL